jgi:hypothetical protein
VAGAEPDGLHIAVHLRRDAGHAEIASTPRDTIKQPEQLAVSSFAQTSFHRGGIETRRVPSQGRGENPAGSFPHGMSRS